MEGIKRKFSEEKDLLDGKKIKKEQVPVFVEIQEAKGDSFCLPNTHLRINHNQNLDNLPFQCDICWKKFNFFASFALHAQMAHKEGCRTFQPLTFINPKKGRTYLGRSENSGGGGAIINVLAGNALARVQRVH
jgi:hypothetical protein